ncbi:MAG TPA: hypothetical protein VH679_11195 [Vicinamibacterales bacterium]|jgi:hypothetical protein
MTLTTLMCGGARRLLTAVVCAFLGSPAAFAGQSAPAAPPAGGQAQSAEAPYLRDRGPGLPTSMFGTYIRRGELIVYPFYEYYRDHDFEYKPSELGGIGEVDYRGRFRAHEGLVLISYGLTDNLAFEVEIAAIAASLKKSPDDHSALPDRLEESGLGDVEGQLRWRWRTETDSRPEVFSYAEIVVPHAKSKPLTGTAGWELKFGTGVVRGFRWGTLTARGAIEYAEASSSHFDVGEYALEYVRRLSPKFRIFAGIEGTQDELSAIAEAQWHIRPGAIVKLNLGRGLTSKATDWAPELGILFTWGR